VRSLAWSLEWSLEWSLGQPANIIPAKSFLQYRNTLAYSVSPSVTKKVRDFARFASVKPGRMSLPDFKLINKKKPFVSFRLKNFRSQRPYF
jgi:hypothetical protein